MELRSLAVFLGLCLLAVSQCSEARHSIERRNADDDDDIFAADEASDDEGTQNDDLFGDSKQEANTVTMIQATILTKPKTYEVPVGDEARLECKVNPDNGTVVQWFRNNTLIFIGGIKVGDNERYAMANDSKDLIIKNVEPYDSTVFRCEVAQETDPVHIEHYLEVLEPPRIVRFTATNNGNLVEGANLLLTCDIRGRPPPQIYWSRTVDGGNYRLSESDGEFTSNSVFIRNVKREDSGKYYCYVMNDLGNHQAELRVSVASKPRVVVRKTIVNSAINVEAVLQCSARYEANPHIRWYKDGLLLEDSSSQYFISTNGAHSNLTVTPTSAADFGVYTCEAENDIGKHNRSIELVQKPVVESLGADNGKLSWTIHSHQPLQEITAQVHQLGVDGVSEWQDIKIPLPSNHHHKYDLTYNLHDSVNAGKYEAIVKVKNDHSWSDVVDPIIFDIEIEPQSIQHASVYGGNSHSIRPSSIILTSIMMYVLVRLL